MNNIRYDFTLHIEGDIDFSIDASSREEMEDLLSDRIANINFGDVIVQEPMEEPREIDEYDYDGEPADYGDY